MGDDIEGDEQICTLLSQSFGSLADGGSDYEDLVFTQLMKIA